MTDKRRAPRRRVLKGGQISFHRLGTIDCAVRNLSATGACLIVASPIGIPDEFDFIMDRDKIPRRCRIEWRSANKIGVSFL
jgi:hypothetical protein